MDLPTPFTQRVLFGAAFYDEYRVHGSLDSDLDLMREAGFSVIRVGESVWSSWEPHPGHFELDWLQPVLDGAAARGIAVVLGTPTYAVPPWLQRLHPEIAAETATGERVGWGGRQEIDYRSAAFRHHAERVIRAVIGRYADHPAVIGFQVDNEPGLHLLHNDDVFAGFLDFLRDRYATVEQLNEAWGLTYWSHRLRDWDDLWRPDGNTSPQYQLEWRRYQAEVVGDFISWQADIVREFAHDEQFVTTCISYERPAVDDLLITRDLDVTAGNPYYVMQDGLRNGVEVPRTDIWYSTGVWGLIEQGDRMFSTSQRPFLVTETNAQSIGQTHGSNHPPYPGQIALAATTLIARGARMIEYWQWQTLHSGIETYWGSVLPHSGRPGRIYREIAALGQVIRALEPVLEDYRPDHDVTFLYSTDTKRSYEFFPPTEDADGRPDATAYLTIFDAYYRGAVESGNQVRIVHDEQFAEAGTEAFVREHPVLVVPTLYVADDALLDRLDAYARAGGHLVIGIRTGYGDELARARPEVAPGRLAAAAGIEYDEFTSVAHPIPVRGLLTGGAEAFATRWADGVELDGAEALVEYTSGIYAGRAAVSTHGVDAGRTTYVGTVPDRTLAEHLLRWVSPEPRSTEWRASEGITILSGRSSVGRVWFLGNWTPDRGTVTVPDADRGVLRLHGVGERVDLERGGILPVAPWTMLVVVEEPVAAPVPDSPGVVLAARGDAG